MSVKTAVVLLLAVACLSGCGKAETPSASGGGREISGEGDTLAKLQSVTNDYVREVVEEAKGVRVIYTDGAFDDDIRHEAKSRGVELEPISMLNGRAPHSLRDAVEKGEDELSSGGLKSGGARARTCRFAVACWRVRARCRKRIANAALTRPAGSAIGFWSCTRKN